MLQLIFLLSCLVLSYISSSPLSSDGDSWSASSSDEDMKPPAVFPVVGVAYQHTPPTLPEVPPTLPEVPPTLPEVPPTLPEVPPTLPEVPPTLLEAPPGVIVEVKDTKTNSTLSFIMFVLAEDETDASGSSSEECQTLNVQPMASLPQTETETSSRPIRREYEEENVSSEEMMSDQPMIVTPSEEFDALLLNATESSVSPTFGDDFNNSAESSEVIGYFNDKNNSRSEDFTNDLNSKETSDPPSDDFNNSTESAETNDQPARNVYRPVSQSSRSGKTGHGEVVSSERSVSEEFTFGSKLLEVFRSIKKVVDLLSVDRGVTGTKGSHRKVLGLTPASLTGKQTGFTLSSDESDESSESVSFGNVSTDPKNHTRVRDSDESLEATSSTFQQGTGQRDSTLQLTGSTTNAHSDLSSSDPNRKQVQDASVKFIRVENAASSNPVSLSQDVESMFFSMPQDTVSKESSRSFSQVNVSLNSDSSEESQEVTVPTTSLTSELSSPDPERKQVQDASVKSIQVDIGVSSNPVSPDEDVASPIFSTPVNMNVSLNSDSSEESQEVVGLTASVPGLSRVGSPDVSSSSEEVLLVLSSPKTPTESGHFTSEPEDSSDAPGLDFTSDLEDLSDSGSTSDSPGNDSQSAELHLDPVPTSVSNRSPEFNLNFSSEISQETSEESLRREANPNINYRTYTASSETNMDTKPDRLVKESAADLSLKATSDSSNDVSIEAEPHTSPPSVYVSSGASHGANTDTGSESSVEKKENAPSTEATADSGKPTEYPAGSGASIGANANVEREKAVSDVSTDAKPDVRKRPPPPPPRRKRPFRFGFLGPISHSHGNQLVAVETASKETTASSQTNVRETLALKRRQNVYGNLLGDLFNGRLGVSVARDSVARDSVARDSVAVAQSSSEETT